MDKLQEDTLGMLQAVHEVLKNNETVYAANLPFIASVSSLDNSIKKIEELRNEQMEDTTGVTQDKKIKRKGLEEITLKMAGALTFYASVNNNRALMDKVRFTKSNIKHSRDNELPGKSEQVHQEAAAHAAALMPFGVTPALINDFADSISVFVDYINKPRAAETQTQAATELLPVEFDQANKVMQEQLDCGMELYSRTHSDFYSSYFNARILVKSPRHTRAFTATFIDSVTQHPIANVNVVVDHIIKKRSSKKGTIRVQSLSEGTHTVVADFADYNPINLNFNVISGETTKLILEMVKV